MKNPFPYCISFCEHSVVSPVFQIFMINDLTLSKGLQLDSEGSFVVRHIYPEIQAPLPSENSGHVILVVMGDHLSLPVEALAHLRPSWANDIYNGLYIPIV